MQHAVRRHWKKIVFYFVCWSVLDGVVVNVFLQLSKQYNNVPKDMICNLQWCQLESHKIMRDERAERASMQMNWTTEHLWGNPGMRLDLADCASSSSARGVALAGLCGPKTNKKR